jgi:hypothetical protein
MLMRNDVVEDRPWSAVERELDPLHALLDRQDGVIARWQALGLMTEKSLRHKVATGRWRSVHRGVLLTYGGSVTGVQRWWIAVLAARPQQVSTVEQQPGMSFLLPAAVLGGLTALQAIGLRGIGSDHIHVIVPNAGRVTPPARVAVHRVRELPSEDRHPLVRPPATSPGRSLVEAAAWSRSSDEARLIIAASFQQAIITADDVYPVLDRMPTVRRRRLILATVRDCAGGSHSIGELNLVGLCRRGRLPLPTRQLCHRDATGRVRYLDACFDDWHLVVEIDGAHHADVGQMWEDSVRQNDLLLAGYKVLRYPVHVLRTQPHRVIAEIRAALQAAGWSP